MRDEKQNKNGAEKRKSHFQTNDKASNSEDCYRRGCMIHTTRKRDIPTIWWISTCNQLPRAKGSWEPVLSLLDIMVISLWLKVSEMFLRMQVTRSMLGKRKVHYLVSMTC